MRAVGCLGASFVWVEAHEEGGETNKGGHMEGGAGAPGACYVGEHVVVRTLGGYGPLFVVAEFCLYLGLWPKAWPKARDRLLGISGEYINKNKLAGVQRTAGMWWFLQTCTRFCMKCFESTCGFVYPVRET